MYTEILEEHMLPSRPHLFQKSHRIYKQDGPKPRTAHVTKGIEATGRWLHPVPHLNIKGKAFTLLTVFGRCRRTEKQPWMNIYHLNETNYKTIP